MRRLLLAFMLAGCTLSSKATPVDFRYFSPEPAASHPASRRGETLGALRLGHVSSSANLRARIVHRDSAWELGEYETLRWTENPEMYVRRSLARELFEDRAFDQAVGGTAPVLDVEIVAFEEVRRPRGSAGLVQLRWLLHDDRTTLGSGDLAVERDASTTDIEHVVPAIAAAMTEATHQLGGAVAARMIP